MSSSEEILSSLTPTLQELLIQLSINRPEDPVLYTATFFKSKWNSSNYGSSGSSNGNSNNSNNNNNNSNNSNNSNYINNSYNEEVYNNIIILLYRSNYKSAEFQSNLNQAFNLLEPKTGKFGIQVADFKKLLLKVTLSFHPDIIKDIVTEYIKSTDVLITYAIFCQAMLTCIKCQEFITFIESSFRTITNETHNFISRYDYDTFLYKLLPSQIKIPEIINYLDANTKPSTPPVISYEVGLLIMFKYVFWNTGTKYIPSKTIVSKDNMLDLSQMLSDITKSK